MDILEKIYGFYNAFDGEKGFIGYTEQGKPIPYFKVKKTDYPKILIQYAIHAREYVTAELALLQIIDFVKNGKKGTIYFIPAVNLDGIEIALNFKPLYKANSNGVDLNVNFDARWGMGKDNVRRAGDENYIGIEPFSESETRALRDFTYLVKPDITVSYHSKGEEIYWEFFQEKIERERDYNLAKKLSLVTGYTLKSTPFSAGGYKDWCIEKLKIPSFTIEVGRDEINHPVCTKYLMEIFLQNREVIKVLVDG